MRSVVGRWAAGGWGREKRAPKLASEITHGTGVEIQTVLLLCLTSVGNVCIISSYGIYHC